MSFIKSGFPRALAPLLIGAFLLMPGAAFGEIDRVLVDKSQRKMFLLKKSEIVRQFTIALGGIPKGHKKQEGDQKTPEGVYVLDYVNEDSDFYRSMHINYPNALDREEAASRGVDPGGMIMVHGQKDNAGMYSGLLQLFDWTDGCIALSNSEMDEFLSLVPVGTEIEIRW
ncbi:L,D-transpeptidase family protein [Sneathiella litorea]|uniref:L,D-transpeptidase family protein n=1 Tax=Sneathiella litorea TaxID=2606216 RepID=A0A6L8W408_9PROT|nr:L,D-transpeptidase family protein [Sneathiella litorea]MZR29293.1 L,D-transpeptidase family protein [Sneathiella litorea]